MNRKMRTVFSILFFSLTMSQVQIYISGHDDENGTLDLTMVNQNENVYGIQITVTWLPGEYCSRITIDNETDCIANGQDWFQLDGLTGPDVGSVMFGSAEGGLLDEYGFHTSTNESGLILSYNLAGDYIPAGEGLLTQLSWNGADLDISGEMVIQYTNVSDWGGNAHEFELGPTYCYRCTPLGDMDDNGVQNVLDLVLMVNQIVAGNFVAEGDLNEDGMLDILDVVLLLNIVLGIN